MTRLSCCANREDAAAFSALTVILSWSGWLKFVAPWLAMPANGPALPHFASGIAESQGLIEEIYPDTKHGGARPADNKPKQAKSQVETLNVSAPAQTPSFIDDAAAKTGKSRASIAREVRRGRGSYAAGSRKFAAIKRRYSRISARNSSLRWRASLERRFRRGNGMILALIIPPIALLQALVFWQSLHAHGLASDAS
jgi:hypothetical protein